MCGVCQLKCAPFSQREKHGRYRHTTYIVLLHLTVIKGSERTLLVPPFREWLPLLSEETHMLTLIHMKGKGTQTHSRYSNGSSLRQEKRLPAVTIFFFFHILGKAHTAKCFGPMKLMYMHICVCACVRTCMRACVHACMHVCACACMRACVSVCVCRLACMPACV